MHDRWVREREQILNIIVLMLTYLFGVYRRTQKYFSHAMAVCIMVRKETNTITGAITDIMAEAIATSVSENPMFSVSHMNSRTTRHMAFTWRLI